jgi:hypothetical protein
MDISSIIKNIDTNVLNEETATAIAEAFESAVNDKVTSRVTLEVESALSKQDDEHSLKLESLLEAIDTDHTAKLQKVVNTINEDHANKLEKIVSFYRNAINEKANSFSATIVENVSNFLDLYLEKAIPQTEIEEAVSNTVALRQIEKIKTLLSFDQSCLNEDVKNLISTGKGKIDDLQNQLNESYKENLELNEKVKALNANILLEKKSKGMPSAKKEYIGKLLSDKSPSYIEENFNFVVEMFEREDSETSAKLVEEAKSKAFSKDARIPKAEVIAESSTEVNNAPVNEYLTALKGIDKR